jgi:glycerate 2-kinase
MMFLTSRKRAQRLLSYRHPKRWLSQLAKTSAVTTTLWLGGVNAAWVSRKPSFVSQPLRGSVPSQFQTFQLRARSSQTEQEMTQHALQIIDRAIKAVDPYMAVKSHFEVQEDDSTLKIGDEQLKLSDYDELVLVAFGKASSAMATAVLEQLQTNDNQHLPSCSGVVICKDDHATEKEQQVLSQHGVQVQMASHPVPDERSAKGASALLDLVKRHASPKTLVVCCISGGGSALFCQPISPLTLADLQAVNSVLLASGMGIQEMNVIRKRLETGKGGRLAALCHPSQLVTLVLSDVLGDPLDLIASGPTVPDTSTWQHAWELIEQYELEKKLPGNVMTLLENGRDGALPDSPSSDHAVFQTCKTVLVGNNALAVEAAAKHAATLGYHPVVLGTHIEGEAKEIAHMYTGMALHLQQQPSLQSSYAMAPSLPVALIAGGETTVSLTPDSGKGGRNQELALSAALQLESLGLRNVVLASVGTDGTDGPTDAAGAVVDATTVSDDLSLAREALSKHNAYPYLEQLGQKRKDLPSPLVKTGPTGTNVADVCVTLVGPAP